jgi:hypothetical protein
MNVSFKKIATLSIYFISAIALCSIIIGFITGNQLKRGGNSEIEHIVLTMYDDIDTGKYEELFNVSFEGKWGTKDERAKEKFYYFDGIVSKNNFIKRAMKDFGKNGWRVRFTSLEIRNIRSLTRSEFAGQYPQENEVLQYVDGNNDIKTINLVKVKGYMVGRCAIIDWEKELPIVWTSQKWKALIRGNPADFDILHREQWFTNIHFNI